jgi:hypothetical protein
MRACAWSIDRMFDIADEGISDHLSETGEAVSITAPIKVAPIKSIFRIVVLLYLALLTKYSLICGC